MKVLFIVTSAMELNGILKGMAVEYSAESLPLHIRTGAHDVYFQLCDPGIFSMSFHLTRLLEMENFDMAVNPGICGSYKKELCPGTVVNVEKDYFADMGVFENGSFYDLFDMGFIRQGEMTFRNKALCADSGEAGETLKKFPGVTGLTVNQIPVNPIIFKRYEEFNPEIESMEGAAFLYVCAMKKLAGVQLRVVSNYAGERDKTKWEISKSLVTLGKELKILVNGLQNT